MKVLLCEDVEKLGWLGDIVEVKNGYARNYLLPQGFAMIPSEANIRSLAEEKARRAEIRRLARQEKERLAQAVNGAEVSLTAKANQQGRLFGSITEKDIAEDLRRQGFAVADEMIRLDGPIKEVGSQDVVLKTAADLTATVRVHVAAEDQPVDSEEEANRE